MKRPISKEIAQALGSRLARLREELNLTQSEVAEKMGVTYRVYRHYENGVQVPGSDKLVALLRALNDLNPAWLTMGEDMMFKSSQGAGVTRNVLEILQNQPLTQRIVIMLKGMDEEDLRDILYRVSEKKRLRELEMELRDVGRKLRQPDTQTVGSEPADKPES